MGRRRRTRRKLKLKLKPKNKTHIPAAAAEAFPPWIELPLDLTANILHRLGALDILWSAQIVCATWWNVCKDPAMWRVINIVNPFVLTPTSRCRYTGMCRCAVDRSQGQLVDLTLPYLGHDELLDYIIHRSRHLRRLTVACYKEITATLVEAIKRAPELEELHLVETIGVSCPMLKSFTLKNHEWRMEKKTINGGCNMGFLQIMEKQ